MLVSCENGEVDISDEGAEVQMPEEGLVAYYPLDGNANDQSGSGLNASVVEAPSGVDRFGVDNGCYHFNGIDEYIEIPDDDLLSVATSGKLSVSAWMHPDTYNFPNTEGTGGYVHWIGKGGNGQHEWTFRMYNYDSYRPNRMSCYVFNLNGGLGAGSFVEAPFVVSDWVHITAVYNFPKNEIKIYKNAILRDADTFTSYDIVPVNGVAPLRFGTQDFNSFFKGAIDDVRIYNRVLSEEEIDVLYNESK